MKIQGRFAKNHTIVVARSLLFLMSLLFSSSNNKSPETFMFYSGSMKNKLALETKDCHEHPDAVPGTLFTRCT